MGLKDILVHVDGSEAALKVAKALAERHEARITGLHVMEEAILPPAPEYPVFAAAYYEEFDREAKRKATEARTRFDRLLDRTNLAREWRVTRGMSADILRRHARYCDLLIVGRGALATIDLNELLLETGRPILVVPDNATLDHGLKTVLVAWDDGVPATRAVHDALPILADANRIQVVAVNPSDSGDHGPIPCADLCTHLARHGLNVEASSFTAADADVASLLSARAFEMGADLIVMGAYGHRRMREFVLGGVTRHMLAHAAVPVLMSH